MTNHTTVAASPAEALAAAREFFEAGAGTRAWVEDESDTHISAATFRGNIAVAVRPGPDGAGSAVRVTTLREEGIVPRLLAHMAAAGSGREMAAS